MMVTKQMVMAVVGVGVIMRHYIIVIQVLTIPHRFLEQVVLTWVTAVLRVEVLMVNVLVDVLHERIHHIYHVKVMMNVQTELVIL